MSDVALPIDRTAMREGDDFCAELLGLADELSGRPEDLIRFAREAFADLPDELRGVALPSGARTAELLRAAEQLALERFGDPE